MLEVVRERRLESWSEIVEACNFLTEDDSWVFRGQFKANWSLESSIEREFPGLGVEQTERAMLQHFIRRAPRLATQPDDSDVAAWLGLLQHYGGVTRLLDVSRSPYVALFFAFESPGEEDRALWAVDAKWCQHACETNMKTAWKGDPNSARISVEDNQRELLERLWGIRSFRILNGVPHPMAFQGVFLLEPWKPDARQSAQQALFLCPADLGPTFMDNLAALPVAPDGPAPRIYKFIVRGSLRGAVLRQLVLMNVSAATLFPGFDGVARSTRVLPVQRGETSVSKPPSWAV